MGGVRSKTYAGEEEAKGRGELCPALRREEVSRGWFAQ